MSDLTQTYKLAKKEEHEEAWQIAVLLNELAVLSDFGALGVQKVKTEWNTYERDDGEYVVGAPAKEAKTVTNAAMWLKEKEIITDHCAVIFKPPHEDKIGKGKEPEYMITLELPDIDDQRLREVNARFSAKRVARSVQNFIGPVASTVNQPSSP